MVAPGPTNTLRRPIDRPSYSSCLPARPGRTSRVVSRAVCSSRPVAQPSNPYRVTPGAGARLGSASARLGSATAGSSAAFGQPVFAPSQVCTSTRGKVWIQAGAYRRGNTLVVCATLAPTQELTPLRDLAEHKQAIKGEKDLVVGQLENGLRYVLLPNKLPPQRFEAHLEVHAGSVDEREDEQGIAHLVEHVTFLGSRKRENLLGTGARANAYTDFHHTVFHVHAPVLNGITGQQMLPQVLDALEEIAFEPQFASSRIEKERKAVLAEAQMMNTIEYRVDCQLLQYLHEENNLGFRFPIGKTDQVKTWPHEALKAFWERWYFPANVTLYLVGDFDRPASEAIELIRKTFGKLAAGVLKLPAGDANGHAAENGHAAAAANGHALTAKALLNQPSLYLSKDQVPMPAVSGEVDGGLLKARHEIRPPVVHKFGHGPLAPGEKPAPISIFRHPLLQHYMLSIFCKLPIQSMTSMDHLKHMLMVRIILSVFQFRINSRYVNTNPGFISITLDISDSGREGCAVSRLTITSEPADWRCATAGGGHEVRRLQRHGLTQGELDRYRQAILLDSAQLAQQANKIPSLDTLNFVMESLACGHTVMGHKDAHEAMEAVAATMTLEEINRLARSMLTFASDYGFEAEVLAEAAQQPEAWGYLGPTRATSAIACIPAYIDASGQSVAGTGGSAAARASLGASGHLDADAIDLAELEKESQAAEAIEIPEGAVAFDPKPDEIAGALSDMSLDVEAISDVELPEHLMSEEEVEALVAQHQPRFLPPMGPGCSADGVDPSDPFPPPETNSGVVQRRLSNGLRINYRHTDNETSACLLRVIASGGRNAENMHTGPDGFGAVCIGTRALSESGTVGTWARKQTEVFCVANLINCALEADEENIIMDFHFAMGANGSGMQKVFELIHLFLSQPAWCEDALERAKLAFASSAKSVGKSLERATGERVLASMLGTAERCFREPSQEEIDALTLEGCRQRVMSLMHTGNLEVNIVGDFEPKELERCLLRYLGTVPPAFPDPSLAPPVPINPFTYRSPSKEERHQDWHLKDSDERACAYIAGPAPARWGPLGYFGPLDAIEGPIQPPLPIKPGMSPAERAAAEESRRKHPLFASVVLMLLTEIINSRLFTTVRDSLGLTYDVSFEVTMFDRLRGGWFTTHVTSHPDRIYDALHASVAVLRDLAVQPISRRELSRARTTLLTRHESDLKDNAYWLGLLTHLQNPRVPHKTVTCLRDLTLLYELATLDDVNAAYKQLKLGDEDIFTCVGTSGKVAPAKPNHQLAGFNYLSTDEEEEGGGDAAGGQGMPQVPNPVALFTAWLAAAQAANISSAVKTAQQDGAQQQQQQGQKQ